MYNRSSLNRDVFVAIDINATDEGFEVYDLFAAKKKIALIESRVRDILEALKRKEPGNRVVIGYREYGITEADERPVSRKIEKYLEKRLRKLVDQYPHLVVIAGPMAVYKIKKDEVLDPLIEEYQTNPHFNYIRYKERKATPKDQQVNWHEMQLNEVRTEKNGPGICALIRNSTQIVTEEETLRNDKSAPFRETKGTLMSRAVLKTPKHRNPFLYLDGLCLQLATCRENDFKTLETPKRKNVDVYVLMSDSIAISFNYVKAKYAFTLDSFCRPALIVVDPNDKDNNLAANNIVFYTSNLFEDGPALKGPFRPISQLASTILTALDMAISEIYTKNIIRKTILVKMRTEIAEAAQVDSNASLCEMLQSQLNEYKSELVTQPPASCLGLFRLKSSLSEEDRYLNDAVAWLQKLIDEQKNINAQARHNFRINKP